MTAQSGKRERNSNIELLRILTMLGVIILHYNNISIGGGLSFVDGDSINKYVLYFLESLAACGVNLFVFITGYYLCTSFKRDIWKPIDLVIEVIIINFVAYFIRMGCGAQMLSIKDIVAACIPSNWFVILYVALYFLSLFLNAAIDWICTHKNGRIQYRNILLVLIVLFSVWPTLVDVLGEVSNREWLGLSTVGMYGSQYGYSIVNFSLAYCVGAYLRMNKKKTVKKRYLVLAISANTVVITTWALINDMIGYGMERSAWEYCNPLIILNSVLIFKLFEEINIPNSSIINHLAKASFTAYLLHNYFLPYIAIEKAVKANVLIMCVHMLASTVCIYMLAWIVFEIYHRIINPILTMCRKKFAYWISLNTEGDNG